MVLDFDVLEFCRKTRAEHGPPYYCPLEKCNRNYKSVCGLQYHLQNYDHDNPTPIQTPSKSQTPSKNKKGRRITKVPAPPPILEKDVLTFDEAQRMVQFEVNGKTLKFNINDTLSIENAVEEGEDVKPTVVETIPVAPEPSSKLPEATYKELDDYNICDAPPRPNAYIRFIEKSVEELDGEVEYDVDEEDTAWLNTLNEERETAGLSPVTVDTLELLMDRLEKESYFQAAVNGQTGVVVDDDAVCCICMDGECQNTNVILFCDMCNLAVHQDCYGVPYIPEGQWLCRRCLQSPSRAVDCVLCPNQGGAFKQTDRGHWAHVVCALWIPEVRFANTVFLEPIDSIETIPPARWKLTCYVCKQRGVGACIQCHKTNCYSAFHVTCAQQAGLYMKMDTVKDGGEAQPVLVQKTAYCDTHTPADSDSKKEDPRQRMKLARKMLAKKRSTVPVILIPTIPPERIQEIGSLVTISKKPQFIRRLIAYWTLKRQYRNGVPLLRRLQSSQGGPRDSSMGNVDTIELCRQLKYWQCLRQDLERARLLCELVRKREKLKLEYTKSIERCLNAELFPLEFSLGRVLDLVASKDNNEIFSEPVDLEEVPDYTTVVTHPMDLSTMKQKLENGDYEGLTGIEKDFELMISNCLAYNNRDTVFYRAGIKMRDQCTSIFRQARRDLEAAGLLEETKSGQGSQESQASGEENLAAEIDHELELLRKADVKHHGPEYMEKLEHLLTKSQSLKHGLARAKRVKIVRLEITKAKRHVPIVTDSSQSDLEGEAEAAVGGDQVKISPQTVGTSPSGVNRRNAVLFTRKAQAALKKPAGDGEEKGTPVEATSTSGGIKQRRKTGRPRRTNANESATNVPDSFRVYRAGGNQSQTSGDEESDSAASLSTCYSHSASEIESDLSSDSENASCSENATENAVEKSELRPLQLVWAKCRGYPWYPALIIDPTMPRGYVHHGVPIPAPPQDVLALSSNYVEKVFLVLFFDAKRTWQWLPSEKLELLGLDTARDQAKANEPRKPTDRKAVRRAYQNALQHLSQISEPPGPDAIM